MDIIEKAHIFASAAHAAVDQRRKYTNEPYIVHPREVAMMVAAHGGTDEMVAAAWLHDVVEDTHVTNDLVTEVFGDVVGEYVGWLTDVSRPEYGNRAVRKKMDRDYIAAAPAEAQTIKLCDLISNCSSIMEHDQAFAKTYFEEKRLLLEVLTKGNPVLLERARAIVL